MKMVSKKIQDSYRDGMKLLVLTFVMVCIVLTSVVTDEKLPHSDSPMSFQPGSDDITIVELEEQKEQTKLFLMPIGIIGLLIAAVYLYHREDD